MRRYGKLTAFLLTGMLCLSLGACGGEEKDPGYTVGGSLDGTVQSATGDGNSGVQMGENSVSKDAADSAGEEMLLPNTTTGEIVVVADKKGNTATTGDDMVYVARELNVVSADFTEYSCMTVHRDKLCYGADHTVISYPLDGGAMEMDTLHWEEQQGGWKLRQLAFDNSENVYAIVLVDAIPNSTPYLCKFDVEGQNVYAYALTELLEKNLTNSLDSTTWSSSWKLAADKAGNVFFLAGKMIFAFDAGGEYAEIVDLGKGPGYEVTGLTGGNGHNVYAVYHPTGNYDSTYVGQLHFDSMATVNVNKGQNIKGVCAGGDGEVFLYTADTVYTYDAAVATMTAAFKWLECEVNSNDLRSTCVSDDGIFVAATFGTRGVGEVQLIQKMTESDAKAAGLLGRKTTLTLAVCHEYIQQLTNAVADFNKTNQKYSVVIENYSAEAVDAQAALNRLNSEIVSGKGPDMLAFGDFDELAKKGGLVNLYDFLEISAELSKEDFFEKILEYYTVDGILTAIPQNFYLNTLVASSDVVGEEMGWTLEELYALAAKYPGQLILGRGSTMTKSFLLRRFLEFNGEPFLDEEAGTCNFNTEEFKKILEFAKNYPTEYESSKGKPSIYTRLETGEVLIAEVNASGIRKFQAYDEALGGKMVFIGYPTAEGVGCDAQLNDAIAINANSANQEGAWAFLEFYLQYYDVDNLSFINGLPSNMVVMEKMAKASMTDDVGSVVVYGDGWRFQEHKATQEEIDHIYALIDNMQFASVDFDIVDIILEEADSYYSGGKPLDVVIEIIQNRVQIYLDEQK